MGHNQPEMQRTDRNSIMMPRNRPPQVKSNENLKIIKKLGTPNNASNETSPVWKTTSQFATILHVSDLVKTLGRKWLKTTQKISHENHSVPIDRNKHLPHNADRVVRAMQPTSESQKPSSTRFYSIQNTLHKLATINLLTYAHFWRYALHHIKWCNSTRMTSLMPKTRFWS